MKVKISVSYNAANLASQMPKIIDKYMEGIGMSFEKGSKAKIDKGLSPALADYTLDQRRKKGISGTKPLFATGKLYRSIKGTKDGLKMVDYGIDHQTGYKNPTPGWAPIPPREFISRDKKEESKSMDVFKKNIRKAFKK